MKKHLPNILLILFVLMNVFFMGRYILNNGAGKFLATTGIVFLIFGILVFIFFLSIDPGYGWIQSMNLTKNYIMIFVSMAVCVVGTVFIVVGNHMQELELRAFAEENRCRLLAAGHVADVLKTDWYSLRDFDRDGLVSAYLFRKKSDRDIYKIVATVGHGEALTDGGRIRVTSPFIPWPLTERLEEATCPGVFEETVGIRYQENPVAAAQIRFEVLVTLFGHPTSDINGNSRDKEIRFELEDQSAGDEGKQAAGRYVGVVERKM